MLGQPRAISSSVDLYRPLGFKVAPGGAVVIANSGDHEIIKLSFDGDVIWRVGREGQGPGEFGRLYRIAVGANGHVAAFDLRTRDLSWFEPDGTFIRRANLEHRVYAVGNLVLLPDDRVAMVAYVPGASRHAIHVFDTDGEHVNSFGPLPPVPRERQLRDWIAGFLNISGSDLIFTLNVPYEIHRYSNRGDLMEVIRREYDFPEGPGGQVATRDGEPVQILGPPRFVPHPLGVKDLGDGWLVGGVVTQPDTSIWDLFHNGELVASFPAPNGWFVVREVDPERRVLYVRSENAEGDLIYLQVPYTIEGR